MSTYDWQWLSTNGNYATERQIVEAATKGPLPHVSKGQWSRFARLKREAAEASERFAEYEKKLSLDMASCPHPKELVVVHLNSVQDDYGSYTSDRRGAASCTRCRKQLESWYEYSNGRIDYDRK